MKVFSYLWILVVSLTVLGPTRAAAHALFEETQQSPERSEVPARPEKPAALAASQNLVPEESLTRTNGGGNMFCANAKKMEEKLSQPPTGLTPIIEARARQLVRFAAVVCNEMGSFVGFPDSGNRNERLIVNAWAVNNLLSQTATLIRQVVPGFDSDEAARRMMNRVRLNDTTWEQTYRPQLTAAYPQISAANLSQAVQDYQNWANALSTYYRTER